MNRLKTLLFTLLAAVLVLAPSPAPATDVDGPNDCLRDINDMGDAPEGIPAYPSGVIGKFPTCLAPGPIGSQTFDPGCPPISSAPGPTGYVLHRQVVSAAGNYWLGCYASSPAGPFGVDSDADGKVNTPAVGSSACRAGLTTDCVEAAFLPVMTFDQDECFSDGSDASLLAKPVLQICKTSTIKFTIANCGNQRQIFLNILLDMNEDGDWNDNMTCPGVGCAYEWAVKNAPVLLTGPGCNFLTSPAFLVGPRNGFAWMRISISDTPMPDDFPWNGTVSFPSSFVPGGETEDYPVEISTPTPTDGATWGRLKVLYR